MSIWCSLAFASPSIAQEDVTNNPAQYSVKPNRAPSAKEKQDIDNLLNDITKNTFDTRKTDIEQDKPHRTTEELSNWLSGVIMNALEIRHATAKSDAQKSMALFTGKAFKDYLLFLKEQSYWLFITKNYYNMNASSTRPPAQLCAKPVNNFFTWVFEVPVIINLVEDPNSPKATGKNAKEEINLRIRLVRIPELQVTDENPHQILIESWSLQDDSAILNNDVDGCMD
jgi:hypothetical protein